MSCCCPFERGSLKLEELISRAQLAHDREGIRGLATGFGSTAVGYFLQGGAKFAGYEFFKKKLTEASGSYENAVKNRTAIYLAGAACVLFFPFSFFSLMYEKEKFFDTNPTRRSIAEFFADILLTPAEAVRIRLVSDRHYATNMLTGFQRMASEGGLRELYAGFVPILAKQIPCKFFFFFRARQGRSTLATAAHQLRRTMNVDLLTRRALQTLSVSSW